MMYAIDIGNTLVKVAGFEMGEMMLVNSYDIKNSALWKTELEMIAEEKVIITSSSISEKEIIESCGLRHAYCINRETQYPFRYTYKQFWRLGQDRIAGSMGAYRLGRGKHILVIDVGTCVTYDMLEKSGVHLGGMISPGLNMRFRSMHEMTANLPLVEEDKIFSHLASDTEEALQLGGKYGMILEIRGYIEKMKSIFGDINVYLTGGDAEIVNEYLGECVILEKHLILYGLYEILRWNDKEA